MTKLIVYFDGSTPTWGGFADASFIDLPTDDPEEIEEMLREINQSRGTVPASVEHVVFERPND